MTEGFIEVRMTKCRLVFRENELQSLLARDRELWAKAIGRGKGAMRAERTEQRELNPLGGMVMCPRCGLPTVDVNSWSGRMANLRCWKCGKEGTMEGCTIGRVELRPVQVETARRDMAWNRVYRASSPSPTPDLNSGVTA